MLASHQYYWIIVLTNINACASNARFGGGCEQAHDFMIFWAYFYYIYIYIYLHLYNKLLKGNELVTYLPLKLHNRGIYGK